jgi:hypothetical protein
MDPTYPNLPRTTGVPAQAETAGVGGEQVVKNVCSEHADTAPSQPKSTVKAGPLTANHKGM